MVGGRCIYDLKKKNDPGVQYKKKRFHAQKYIVEEMLKDQDRRMLPFL